MIIYNMLLMMISAIRNTRYTMHNVQYAMIKDILLLFLFGVVVWCWCCWCCYVLLVPTKY